MFNRIGFRFMWKKYVCMHELVERTSTLPASCEGSSTLQSNIEVNAEEVTDEGNEVLDDPMKELTEWMGLKMDNDKNDFGNKVQSDSMKELAEWLGL